MITGWIEEKFLTPLCHYYTLEATVAYSLILIAAVYGIYKMLQKLKVKIDGQLLIGVLPFILYGGWVRALRDHDVYQGALWCSPPIYVAVAAMTVASLLIGLFVQKRYGFAYHKTMLCIGAALLAYNFTLTVVSNYLSTGIVLLLLAFWIAVLFGINRFVPKLLTRTNAGVLAAHMFDASSTFTALTFFGYYEQHVLPSFLIGATGPWIMFPLKLGVVWAVLYAIDKYADDKQFAGFLKLIVLVLGLSQGTRDFLTMAMA